MEYLDIVDENGEPTGVTVERSKAHAEGIMHRTAHVWIVRMRDGVLEILLQKRSDHKDSFPGCYDISSAGHIPAGVDFKASAVRELREELGVDVPEDALIFCGVRRIAFDGEFHGQPFHDRQFTKVFALWCDDDESAFTPQPEELSEVRWMPFDALITAVENHTIPHCIYPEELRMVENGIRS